MAEITPVEIRDLMINRMISESSDFLKENVEEYYVLKDKKELNKRKYQKMKEIVEGVFESLGEDFHKPTKKSLKLVIDKLRKIGVNYVSKNIVEKTAKDMLDLVDKIK